MPPISIRKRVLAVVPDLGTGTARVREQEVSLAFDISREGEAVLVGAWVYVDGLTYDIPEADVRRLWSETTLMREVIGAAIEAAAQRQPAWERPIA